MYIPTDFSLADAYSGGPEPALPCFPHKDEIEDRDERGVHVRCIACGDQYTTSLQRGTVIAIAADAAAWSAIGRGKATALPVSLCTLYYMGSERPCEGCPVARAMGTSHCHGTLARRYQLSLRPLDAWEHSVWLMQLLALEEQIPTLQAAPLQVAA